MTCRYQEGGIARPWDCKEVSGVVERVALAVAVDQFAT